MPPPSPRHQAAPQDPPQRDGPSLARSIHKLRLRPGTCGMPPLEPPAAVHFGGGLDVLWGSGPLGGLACDACHRLWVVRVGIGASQAGSLGGSLAAGW